MTILSRKDTIIFEKAIEANKTRKVSIESYYRAQQVYKRIIITKGPQNKEEA